jgi:hypothetical protein
VKANKEKKFLQKSWFFYLCKSVECDKLLFFVFSKMFFFSKNKEKADSNQEEGVTEVRKAKKWRKKQRKKTKKKH